MFNALKALKALNGPAKISRLFMSALVLAAGSAFAQVKEDSSSRALALLNAMEQSLSTASYTGIYTYEHTGVMDSIRVTKLVIDGKVTNRLEHLSGRESKAIVHAAGQQSCGDNLTQLQNVFDKDNLNQHYRFLTVGYERVAGRKTLLLQADPRDEYRFGYRLAVDEETKVPLLLALVSGNRLVERFQFVDFTPIDEPQAAQAPLLTAEDHVLSGACIDQNAHSPWIIGWIPAGYQLVAVKSDNGTDMFSYSDGLSRVSVFVSALAGDTTLEGEARRGATLVYLHKVVVGDRVYQVSVVGEVPTAAAQKIATSVVAQQ